MHLVSPITSVHVPHPASQSVPDPVICHCHGVRESAIRAAIRTQNAASVSELTTRTSAGSACSACVRRLRQLIEGHPAPPATGRCSFCTRCRSIAALCQCEQAA